MMKMGIPTLIKKNIRAAAAAAATATAAAVLLAVVFVVGKPPILIP